MKTCSKCKQAKELACFSRCSAAKDGLNGTCKPCAAARSKDWRERNQQHVDDFNKKYREENKEKRIKVMADWRDRNRDHISDYNKKKYAEKAEERRDVARNYYYENRDKYLQRHAENNENPEVKMAKKKYNIDYVEKNREELKAKRRARSDYNSMKAAERRVQKQSASIQLSEEHQREIRNIYWLALDLRRATGEQYDVDHIVPIKGKNICGLHVPWNLQILPSDINKSKSNSFKQEDAFAEMGFS